MISKLGRLLERGGRISPGLASQAGSADVLEDANTTAASASAAEKVMAELAQVEAEEEELARFVRPLRPDSPPVACLLQRHSKSCIAMYTAVCTAVVTASVPAAVDAGECESESDSVSGSAAAMPAASSSEASESSRKDSTTVAPAATASSIGGIAATALATAEIPKGAQQPVVAAGVSGTEYRFLAAARLISTGTLSRGVTFHVYTSSRALHAHVSDLIWDGSECSSKGGQQPGLTTPQESVFGFCGKLSISSSGPASKKMAMWATEGCGQPWRELAHLDVVKQAAQAEALAQEHGIDIVGTGPERRYKSIDITMKRRPFKWKVRLPQDRANVYRSPHPLMRLQKRIDREPLPSVKNLQLVHGNPTLSARNGENAAVVELGKSAEDRFEMKVLAPFSLYQAFALAVSSLHAASR